MSDVRVKLYRDLCAAAPYLRALAQAPGPWTFDIETYDAGAFPSRKTVSTDPHHPDFRLHGVAIATSAHDGAYIFLGDTDDCRDLDGDGIDALRAAFDSDAEKGAYNGHFDENGLVYTGWVPRVRNRVRDGMLSTIALGDGTHESLKLPHVAKLLLKRETTWEIDKSTMRDQPVEVVADGAVHDACLAHELCDLLDAWAEEDRRIQWSVLTYG